MELFAINCKFYYVNVISTNNSGCGFFKVYKVQLIFILVLHFSVFYVSYVF